VLRKVDNFISENQKAFKSAVENIDKFSGALARNSDKIDNITTGLQNLTGGADGKGGEINEAARSIKKLADNLDDRTAEITTSIVRLSAAGSRQIESLSFNAQRTLSTINRAVDNLDKNPSRLIWGGSSSQSSQQKGR